MAHAEIDDHPPSIMVGGHVRVERVLLGRLVATGLTPGDVALLLRAYLLGGSTTSHRILSDAAGAPLRIGLQSPSDQDGLPDRTWCDQPFATATVELAPGLGWRDGTLYDVAGCIPATVAEAAVGRPIGHVMTHRDIDPASIILPRDDRRATLRVRIEIVDVPVPIAPAARLRALRMRASLRRIEKNADRRTRYSLAGSAAIALLSYSIGFIWPPVGFTSHLVSGGAFGVAVVTSALAVDAGMGRILTERLRALATTLGLSSPDRIWQEEKADRDHRLLMWKEAERRGFDEDGHPTR